MSGEAVAELVKGDGFAQTLYLYISFYIFCDFFLFFPLLARLVFVAGDLEKSFALLTVVSGI